MTMPSLSSGARSQELVVRDQMYDVMNIFFYPFFKIPYWHISIISCKVEIILETHFNAKLSTL